MKLYSFSIYITEKQNIFSFLFFIRTHVHAAPPLIEEKVELFELNAQFQIKDANYNSFRIQTIFYFIYSIYLKLCIVLRY